MNESLFAAIRIVAMMLAVDREVGPEEHKWFSTVLNTYGMTHMEREILRGDLSGTTAEQLEEVFAKLTKPRDVERLMGLVRGAMNADNKITPGERGFFKRLQGLAAAANPVSTGDYRDYANAILESDKEMQVWGELKQAGDFFSQRVRYSYSAYRWGGPTVMSFFIRGALTRNRFVVGFFILSAVLYFIGRFLT